MLAKLSPLSLSLLSGAYVAGAPHDFTAFTVRFALGALAGLHLANACTAVIDLYRQGMRRAGLPDRTL